MIREWQVRLCEEDYCAAALISFFRYVHDWKVEQRQQAMAANNVAEKHGDERSQYEGLYQYYTYEDLHQRLLGLYSERAIPQSVKRLVDLGVVSKHKNPNPRYSFDKTTYYIFHPDVCNDWISGNYVNGDFIGFVSSDVSTEEFQSHQKPLKNNEISNVTRNADSSGNFATSKVSFLHNRDGKIATSSGNFASPSGKIATAINNNTNYQNNTKKTAAIETNKSQNTLSSDLTKNLAAVSFESQQISITDLTIGAELTAAQLAVVKQRFATVALPKDYCPERLQSELIHTLLNPKAFTDAGHQFDKKLNTLLKRVRLNQWVAPPEIVAEVRQQEEQQAIQELYERNRIMVAICHAERMLEYSENISNPLITAPFLTDLEQARADLAAFDRPRLSRTTCANQ